VAAEEHVLVGVVVLVTIAITFANVPSTSSCARATTIRARR
jgi:hypothetical protein